MKMSRIGSSEAYWRSEEHTPFDLVFYVNIFLAGGSAFGHLLKANSVAVSGTLISDGCIDGCKEDASD
jgi:hypothetical protein